MSMSKKLTFSLASLVLMFGLIFVPAMAQAQEAVPEVVHTFGATDDHSCQRLCDYLKDYWPDCG